MPLGGGGRRAGAQEEAEQEQQPAHEAALSSPRRSAGHSPINPPSPTRLAQPGKDYAWVVQTLVSVALVLAAGGGLVAALRYLWRQTSDPPRPPAPRTVDPIGGPLDRAALVIGAELASPGACSSTEGGAEGSRGDAV